MGRTERLARPLSPPIPNVGILRGRLSKLMTKKHQEPWQWQRDFLPVDVEIATGAVVLGNDATPIVTIAEFKKGNGSLETTEVRCHRYENLSTRSDPASSTSRVAACWTCSKVSLLSALLA